MSKLIIAWLICNIQFNTFSPFSYFMYFCLPIVLCTTCSFVSPLRFSIKSPSDWTSLKMMGLQLLVFMASICLENSIPENDLPVVWGIHVVVVLSPRQVKWAFYLRHKEKKRLTACPGRNFYHSLLFRLAISFTSIWPLAENTTE